MSALTGALRRPTTVFVALFTALTVGLVGALMSGGAATARGSLATEPTVVAKTNEGKMTSRIVGTTAGGRPVVGSFTPLRFKKLDGKEWVKGVVDGVIKRADGSREKFTVIRTLKVKSINGQRLSTLGTAGAGSAGLGASCDILHLTLGPLDLDLLGLKIHLDRVVLNIDADPGPGNLLGNLLCAVAGLLDGNTPLSGILTALNRLLNQILGALNLGL
jgi:hypothetical protein